MSNEFVHKNDLDTALALIDQLRADLLLSADREIALTDERDQLKALAKSYEEANARGGLANEKLLAELEAMTDVADWQRQRRKETEAVNASLRADNEALRARLENTQRLLEQCQNGTNSNPYCPGCATYRGEECRPWCPIEKAIASGSSTGEAPLVFAGDSITEPRPFGFGPAAPEPAPAPAPELRGEACCEELPGNACHNEFSGHFTHRFEPNPHFCEHANEVPMCCPCSPGCYCKINTCMEPAVPANAQELAPTFDQLVHRVGPLPTTGLASAQGTTDSVKVAELRGRLEAQRGKIEDLDKRVSALESWRAVEVNNRQSLETDVERIEAHLPVPLIFSSIFFCSISNSFERRMRIAVPRFLCCDRSCWQCTAMPVGM